MPHKTHATTVIGIVHKGKAALAGDGQVTLDDYIVKATSVKIRGLYDNKILAGFAGTAADGLALFELFEKRIEEFSGNLQRAAVEMAKEWRTDKALQKLEAVIAVTDGKQIFLVSGTGDLLEPDDGIVAIGSGGPFALAAARAFLQANPKMSAADIAQQSLEIAADICIYTNRHITLKTLP